MWAPVHIRLSATATRFETRDFISIVSDSSSFSYRQTAKKEYGTCAKLLEHTFAMSTEGIRIYYNPELWISYSRHSGHNGVHFREFLVHILQF